MLGMKTFRDRLALIVLGITTGWAVFGVLITARAMQNPTADGILQAAGMGVVIGALLAWSANVVQFYFRKSDPNETKPN